MKLKDLAQRCLCMILAFALAVSPMAGSTVLAADTEVETEAAAEDETEVEVEDETEAEVEDETEAEDEAAAEDEEETEAEEADVEDEAEAGDESETEAETEAEAEDETEAGDEAAAEDEAETEAEEADVEEETEAEDETEAEEETEEETDEEDETIAAVDLTESGEATAEIDEAGGYAYFTYTPSTSGYYLFYSTGSYDTYAYLYDADMNQLDSDDDSGTSMNALIQYYLEAEETYYIAFRFYSSSYTGSFSVYAEAYYPAVSAEVVLTQELTLTQGIDSYEDYDYDDEIFDYYDLSYSIFSSGDQIILTKSDDSTVAYTFNGSYFYDSDGNRLNFYRYASTSQYTQHWEVGGTYTVTLEFYNNESVTTEVSVTIVENPYVSAEFVPVGDGLTMTEDIDSYESTDSDGETYNYYSYYNLDFTSGDQIIITLSDGSTTTYTTYGSRYYFYDEDGNYLYIYGYSTQDTEHWEVGNTYAFTVTLSDYGLTLEIPVTIVENPYADAVAEFVPVGDGLTMIEGIDSYVDYDDDDEAYNYYSYYNLDFTSGDQIVITLSDGSTITYTTYGSRYYFYDEDGNYLYIYGSSTQYYDHWEAGNTYVFTVELEDYGLTLEIPVTIKENPYVSAEFVPVSDALTMSEGIDSYESVDSEGETYNYYSIYNLEFTSGDQIVITLSDGSTITFTSYGGYDFYDEDGNYLYMSASSTQYTEHWEVGNTYVFTVELEDYGITVEIPVTIVANPYADAVAEFVPVGDALTMIEGIDSSVDYYEDEDVNEAYNYYSYYNLDFTSGDQIVITLSDGSTITYTSTGNYRFYDEDGNRLSASWSSTQYTEHWEAGNTYTFTVTLSDYGLTVEIPVTIIENPYIAAAVDLTESGEATAEIDEAGGYAYFIYTPSESGYYQFYSTGSYDTYAYLYDADWNQLDWDDDSGTSTNALIQYYLEAEETYYIAFRFWDSSMTGSFSVYAEAYYPAVSAEVVLTQELTLTQGIDSYEDYDDDDEIFDYYNLPYSMFSSGDQIILTKSDGSTVTYTFNDSYFYDSDGNKLYFYRYASTSQYTEHWEVGGTYTVTLEFYNNEYVTTEVSVTIVENPYVSAEFVPIGDGLTMTEGIDSYESADSDGETYNYYSYYNLDFTSGDQIVITLSDGSTITYTSYGSRYFYDEDDNYLSASWSSTQYTEHWEAGNTYVFTVELEDYGITVEIPVTIVANPYADAVAEFVPVGDALTMIEGIDSYVDYDSDGEAYNYYSYYNLDFTSGDQIVITLSDGSTITYTTYGSRYYFYDEDGNSLYVYGSSTQYYDHWEVGGTYTFTVTLSDYGLTVEIPVTIIENPYIAAAVDLTESGEATAEIDEAGGYAYFIYTPSESGYYQFYSTGSYDTYAYLYDADWIQLASDDDSGPDWNARIKYYLEADETYYIAFIFLSSSETGSFSVYAEAYLETISAEVILTQELTLMQGIDSYESDEDDEIFDYYYLSYSMFSSGDQIILTRSDGSTVTYTSNGSYFYDSDGNILYFNKYASTSQYTQHWEVGGTYTVTLVFYNNEYVTAEVSVTIVENPYVSAEFVPAGDGLTMTEGVDSSVGYYDDEAYNYYPYYNLDFTSGDQIVITLNDGSTITYTVNEDNDFYDEDGNYLEFSVSSTQYKDHWEAGNTYVFTMELEDYGLTLEIPVTIVAASTATDISTTTVTLSYSSTAYTGSALTPTVTVKNAAGTTLTKNTDYTVSYSNNTNPGTATVTITGIGGYTGAVTKTFTITKQSLSSSNVTLSYSSATYTGSALTPTVTVKNAAGTTLTKGTHYTVSYSSNTNVGTATVTITGTGSYYSGTVTKTFTINKQSLSSSNVTLSYSSTTYTGSALTPTVTVKNAAGTTLTKGTHYTVSYSSNTNVGTATVTITGTGSYYTGTVTKTFTINKQSLSSSNVTLSYSSTTYTGSALTPTVTVKNAAGTTLTKGTHYTVSYSNNTNAGTATVTITGKGYYSGTVTRTFTINKQTLSSSKVTLSYSSTTYTGSALTPTVTVKNAAGTTLTKSTHYTVSYSNNTNAGTATVTITGKGNYSGTVTKTFTINKQALSSSKVTLSYTSTTYTGKAKKPTATVKNAAGTTLTKGTDYTVTYSSGRKAIGKYTVTIKGKGNYSGTIKKTFKIVPKQVKISSLKSSSSKKLTVKWSKVSGSVTGYQIYYRVKGTSTWSKVTVKATSSSTLSKTISKLKSKKTYQVKIRAYKTVSGTKYYGEWSSTKTVKVK